MFNCLLVRWWCSSLDQNLPYKKSHARMSLPRAKVTFCSRWYNVALLNRKCTNKLNRKRRTNSPFKRCATRSTSGEKKCSHCGWNGRATCVHLAKDFTEQVHKKYSESDEFTCYSTDMTFLFLLSLLPEYKGYYRITDSTHIAKVTIKSLVSHENPGRNWPSMYQPRWSNWTQGNECRCGLGRQLSGNTPGCNTAN